MQEYKKFLKSAFKIFLVLITQAVLVSCDPELIPCPLIWKDLNLGEPYPESFIPSVKYGQDVIVSRANGTVGYTKEGKCYTFDKTLLKVTVHDSFQVLTNPHNCIIDWIPIEDKDSVGNSPFIEENVGRVMSQLEPRLLAGHIEGVEISIVVDQENGEVIEGDVELLKSYQEGLTLIVSNIVIDEGTQFPEFIPKVLGFDQIINRSPGKISQTIRHTSEFESLVKFSKGLWGPVQSIKLEFQFVQPPVETGGGGYSSLIPVWDEVLMIKPPVYSTETDFYDSIELKEYREETIEANVTFTVSPYSSVQICSTADVVEGFAANFTGLGYYRAAGLSGLEVQGILGRHGIFGDVLEDAVVVNITREVQRSFYSSSRFLTAPLDYIGEGSCYQVVEMVHDLNDKISKISEKVKSEGLKDDILKIKESISKNNAMN